MKAWVVLFIVVISLIFLTVNINAQECELATPRYGSVVCRDQGITETVAKNFVIGEKESILSYVCLSECHLNPSNVVIQCDWSVGGWKAEVNGNVKYSTGIFGEKTESIDWNRDDSFLVTASCTGADFWTTHPVKSSSSVQMSQKKIMLEEAWAGSLEYVPIPGTEGCSLNNVIDRYRDDTNVQSYFDPATGKTETKPSSTYTSFNQIPTNWEVSESYIFVKDWQTGIADISLTYDKDDNSYWCGGLSGNRKIYNVQKVNSVTGACYSIPTSISKTNIECCFPADCTWKGSTYTCNPDTWSCEETRWCDSQLDCDQVFGEGICQNRQITSWVCDTNQPWGTHSGTCIRNERIVNQCPSDCTTDEYYNEQEGSCKPRNILLNCPADKCCKEGGNYKTQSCDSGLYCCQTGSLSSIGECKETCDYATTQKQQDSQQFTGAVISENPIIDSTLPIIVGIIVIVAVVGYFGFTRMRKKPYVLKTPQPKPVESEEVKEQKTDSGFCPGCGTKLNSGDIHCSECGEKV